MTNVFVPPMPELPEENSVTVFETEEILEKLGNYPDFIRTDLQRQYYNGMYDKIKSNGTVMTGVDSYALGMLSFNLALVDECAWSIDREGLTLEVQGDRNVITKKNPALEVLKDAQSAVRFYLKEFGMTPNSRGKELNPQANNESNDGFDKV